MLLENALVYVAPTPDKGRGVFAKCSIEKGTLIEQAHVIEIPANELKFLKSTQLFHYFFRWPKESGAIALGHASLYNHSYTPNAYYVKLIPDRMILFYSIFPIEKGSEITINYNGNPHNKKPLWFKTI